MKLDGRSALASLAVIIVMACFVASIWVIRVPFFEEPDELAHADYAMELFDVGRIFRVAEWHPHVEVAPQTRYLVARVGYRKMRYNPVARVSPGYGTAAYFHRLDAGAPHPSHREPRVAAEIPYVMYLYPPGYYVLEATILSATYSALGSLSAGFFAMRAFNVLLLAGTLILSYLSIRAYGFGERTSLLAVLALGLFPLTTIVASYVQPDNATTFLITLVVFAIARGRYDVSVQYDFLAAGGLALLFMVKQHYAFAAWLVTVPAIALSKAPRRRRPLSVAIVVALPLLTFAISNHYCNPVAMLESPLHFIERTRGTLSTPSFALADAIGLIWGAIVECCTGSVSAGFWLNFGIRTGHIFGSDIIGSFLRIVSILGLAAFGVAQWRILKRILVVAKALRLRSAMRLIAAGHSANLFIVTTVMLFSANVLSGGVLKLQGRYWLPMLLPLMILTLRTLPRPLRPRHRRDLAFSMAAAMASYSCVASVVAIRAMNQNFYGRAIQPQLEPVADIIEMRSNDGSSSKTRILNLRKAQSVSVSGYAIDMRTGFAARHLHAEMDGATRVDAARTGLPYPALANVYTDDLVGAARFIIRIPGRSLLAGRHTLRFFVDDQASAAGVPFRYEATIAVAGERKTGERTSRADDLRWRARTHE